MGELNLPFEEVPGGPIDRNVACLVSAGVVVAAITVENRPGLMFTFAADGQLATPIVLVPPEGDLDALPKLIDDAVRAAKAAV